MELTCIVCPMGCRMTIEKAADGNFDVSGNTCPRGKEYAINELTNPVRTLTSTVRFSNGKIAPVKTNLPVPKDMIFDCMKIINCYCGKEAEEGTAIIKDILGTGADVIITGESV